MNKLQLIDWDKVFDWKVWHTVKWFYMAIVIVGIIALIYFYNTNPNGLLFEPIDNNNSLLEEVLQ